MCMEKFKFKFLFFPVIGNRPSLIVNIVKRFWEIPGYPNPMSEPKISISESVTKIFNKILRFTHVKKYLPLSAPQAKILRIFDTQEAKIHQFKKCIQLHSIKKYFL